MMYLLNMLYSLCGVYAMSNVVSRLKYQPQIYIARTKDGHVVSINDVLNEKLP